MSATPPPVETESERRSRCADFSPAQPYPAQGRADHLHAAHLMSLTAERASMVRSLQSVVKVPVAGYAWGNKGIHPVAVLFGSFVVSQWLNELLIYELFAAYGGRGTARAVFEIVSPLTLWFFVDLAVQIVLTLFGIGHRILVQTMDGNLHVFHRTLWTAKPHRLDATFPGDLAILPGSMGYAIDRLETAHGRFYIWARWRDIRLAVSPALLTPLTPMAGMPRSGSGDSRADGDAP